MNICRSGKAMALTVVILWTKANWVKSQTDLYLHATEHKLYEFKDLF